MSADSPYRLPILEHEDEIGRLVREHKVVVIEGPTGCGKTTQLPQILTRQGVSKKILGVTQPRRIAAVSVAWRIADEMGCKVGEEVGFAIRFDDSTGPKTHIKIMTDGILLQESRSDHLFSAYDVIMVDEAHERSLNIDFTLGLLHRALRNRDDLRVIVSSATLNPRTFQDFFASAVGELPPLFSVEARTFPINIVYSPIRGDYEEFADGVANEILDLHSRGNPGHMLVFLTGEGMIKNTEQSILRKRPAMDLVVLPLFGRLTRDEQEQVFAEFPGKRKVILATNIAETSITVPGVTYVLDCGLAKVPRYDPTSGVSTLKEELISLASINQRAGRAGRTAPGTVVRLYEERSLEKRADFTDEEIQRHDLSDVVLRLIDHGIHEVEDFPFPTAPTRSKLRAALQALEAMDAIDSKRNLTAIGQQMVMFPVSPPLSRMIVEAARKHPSVLEDVIIVAAFQSARPPYLYPVGEEVQARRAQEALAHRLGDAMTAVTTFHAWRASGNKKNYCERNYLDPDTMAFVAKAREQLGGIAEKLGCEVRTGGDPKLVNRCVAVAFADKILRRTKGRGYESLMGTEVAIHPSSSIYGGNNAFVVAAELVRSTRVYARIVSSVQEDWLREVCPEAASAWGKGGKGKRAPVVKVQLDDDSEAGDVNETLVLGGRSLQVVRRRKYTLATIPIELVAELAKVSVEELSAEAASFRARVVDGQERYLTRMNLGPLLAILPYVVLPPPQPAKADTVPQGALFESDRNLHNIERYLTKILTVVRPRKGKKPGWVVLADNGAGGFWYDVNTDFVEALEVSTEALSALLEVYVEGDPKAESVKMLATHLATKRSDVRAALARAMRASKGR